ncbi:class I SAM-dependent methyltransferase [Actinoplanes sp. NPDC051411]|uniref:class I SAM-dependent methyltransferase n=1 Tax=Actinoplanes sp. NPDC051411 TaxID=3155522 RepID=UPI003415FC06
MTDYLSVNRANWDERAAVHAASPEYGLARFAADPAFLSDTVRFDRPRLGSLDGQRVVHLQCHIGHDTLSLARLGAASVIGLDFSGPALEVARQFVAGTPNIRFVQSDVYGARAALDGDFDLVYTGVGALNWLPDINRWARTVRSLLRPGGRLHIREGHPVLWSLDYDRDDDLLALHTTYFEQPAPLVIDEQYTYVTTDHRFQATVTHEWNHGLGEIVTALLEAGLTITTLIEHQSVPWNALPGKMRELDDGEWQLIDHPERLPHSYTLQAVV